MASKILAAALLAAVPAVAKTDLDGCTYYDSVIDPGYYAPYNTRVWYVPDSGEICAFLDCGGGRAPPKTTVPGCPQYEGTETYSPLYLDVKTLGGPAATATADAETTGAEEEEESAAETITDAPTLATATATDETTLITRSTAAADDDEDEEEGDKSTASAKDDKTTTKAAAVTSDEESRPTPSASTGAGGSDAASGSGSGSDETDAAATPAPTVSTAGAVMPTAGAFLGSCLMAGAAVYAGML
ncbi:hypothetical protein ACJ41O_008518 [Fusarium nematophilum]